MHHFITFATPEYFRFAHNIAQSALSKGEFDTARIFGPHDIPSEFFKANENILGQPRGAGYWLWKPYVVMRALIEVPMGDTLCYCDSLYVFTGSIRTVTDDIFITCHKPNESTDGTIEHRLSKRDAIVLLDADKPEITETTQAWGGFMVIRKTPETMMFISKWFTYCQDARIITDAPSVFGPEHPEFVDNRHDQTVLSLLAKKHGLKLHDFPPGLLFNLRSPLKE